MTTWRRCVVRAVALAWCVTALACDDDGMEPGEDAAAIPDSAAPLDADAAAIGDGSAPTDAAMIDGAVAPDRDCAAGAPAGRALETLVLELPDEPPMGVPFVVSVTVAGAQTHSMRAVLCVEGQQAGELTLYRGRGSVSLTLDEPGSVRLHVEAATARGERVVRVAKRVRRTELGPVLGDQVVWGPEQDALIQGDVQVLAGTTLTIEAGTRVLLAPNASLLVAGTLKVQGTPEAPVLFTRASYEPWGGIALSEGGSAELTHAWLTAGGGDRSRAFGHSDSQAVIYLQDAALEMHGGGLADNPGKAFGARGARVTLDGVLVTRCDTGGELRATELLVEHGHVLEMPDADRQPDDDDNDGIYVSNPPHDEDGSPIESVIRDTVFAVGEDDAIDHNGAQLRLERVWIEGFRHEGVAASDTNRVLLVDSVVRGCDNGIEAGYGTPMVIVEHSLLTDNGVGLKYGDSYDRAENGSLIVHHSVSVDNRDANVENHVVALDGPREGAIEIDCSMVDSPDYDGQRGNLAGVPEGAWATEGCVSAPVTAGDGCDGTPPGPRGCL